VLFAFEEAIGFMMGQLGHDKDGVAAAAVCAELAAELHAQGATLAQHWQALQQRYGRFEYRSGYFVAQPPSRSAAVFQRLRDAPPAAIAGRRVVSVRDLGTGLDTAQPGGAAWRGGGRAGARRQRRLHPRRMPAPGWRRAAHPAAAPCRRRPSGAALAARGPHGHLPPG
jgi:hypothetical protein